jgi:hypothetical protein
MGLGKMIFFLGNIGTKREEKGGDWKYKFLWGILTRELVLQGFWALGPENLISRS